MEIRMAKRSDIPELQRLLYQVGDVHHKIRPDIFRVGAIKYTEAELSAILENPATPVFAAMEGGLMLGYCFCQWEQFENSTVMTDRKELYIDDLCVDEASRGAGIAKALYDHTLAYARERGCNYITLNCWNGNDRAIRFYEKMGMKPRKVYMEFALEDTEC